MNYAWLTIVICSVASLPVTSCRHAADPPAGGPNVVLIFADDLGYGDIGSFNPECPFRTPNLDRMASQGARLTSFYVPLPYCAPSRGTLLTGRYPFRHGVVFQPRAR
ncbi:MAG: sulfatase-like hydrolase/transferase [Candidatus Aminicenantes bacterium]|nr:sulfatase-like hydrolase/transferase [Candidatus Aminicenantes bacterium]